MKHYPVLIKERGTLTSDEKGDFVLAISNSAHSIGMALVIITQNLIFMPA